MDENTRGTATAEFAGELEKLIDYFAVEFDMSVAQVVGVLEIAKINVTLQQMAAGDDECEECIDE